MVYSKIQGLQIFCKNVYSWDDHCITNIRPSPSTLDQNQCPWQSRPGQGENNRRSLGLKLQVKQTLPWKIQSPNSSFTSAYSLVLFSSVSGECKPLEDWRVILFFQWRCSTCLKNSFFPWRVPIVAQRKQTQLVSMRMWVWSLVLLSGLRIWHCRELWCRSQTRLGSCVAVAVV